MSRAREIAKRSWGVVPLLVVVALFAARAMLAVEPLDNLAAAPADPRDPPGTRAYVGSIYNARGGPVVIGFHAAHTGRLVVGSGEPVEGGPPAVKEIVGNGHAKERIVLPRGPIAIRFAAPPGARLVWSPVGRRGDPEYVPASSLSPDPPERASFGADAGTARLDGLFASLLLVTVVVTLLLLVRHRLRRVAPRTYLAMAAIFVAACGVRWVGLFAFGETWDEDVNWSAGKNYITNILSLDISPASWIWNYQHPPVMKYLAGIGAQLADNYGPARALSAVWLSLGCALLVPIGARLYSLRVGILAGAIAALLPPLVAHGQIVGHESPTVLWWTLAILLALTVHDAEPRPNDATELVTASPRTVRIRLVWLGVVIGVAVASRFVNGLVGPLVLLVVVERAPRARMLRTAIEGALIMPAAAALTLYASWPRLWASPIASLEASVAKLSQPHSPEPFLGAITNNPGPHYFVAYLVATLPVVILAGVVLYVVRAARERNGATLVVLAWLVIPLAVVLSPVRQDGVRYVMPCILALAVAAAAGFDMVASLFARRSRHALAALGAAVVVYLGVTLVRVHPYYLDYFGEHVGGAGTVEQERMFETAWWGEGLDRAVDYVNSNAGPNARVYRNCIEPAHLAWFRYDLWLPMTNNPAQAEWILAYSPATRSCPKPADARRVFVVEAQGATLAEVWQRQP